MIRTGLYERVSHDEQALNGDSLRAQKEILEKYAKENDLYIVKHYIDDGYSAKNLKRPALNELLDDVRDGKIDLIIFTKIDRWSRGVRNYYKIQDILDEHKVNWKTVLEDYDTSTTVGQLQINIMLAIAENEANMASDRIKVVFKSKLEQGEVITGSVPRGYKVKDKKLEIDKEESKIIQDLFNKYEILMNTNQLIKYALDRYEGYTPDVIKGILRNKKYIGICESEYGVFENYCPPIISNAQFENVQRLLNDHTKHYERVNHEYIFRGLAYCGSCGKRLVANTAVRTRYPDGTPKTETKKYRCPNHWRYHTCSNNYHISERPLEKYLLENFVAEFEKYSIEFEAKEKEYNNTVGIDVDKITKKINKLTDLYMEDMIDKDKYKLEYERLNGMLEEYKQVKKPTRQKAKLDFNFNDENALSIYHKLSRNEKKLLWMRFIDKIYIQRDSIKIDFL